MMTHQTCKVWGEFCCVSPEVKADMYDVLDGEYHSVNLMTSSLQADLSSFDDFVIECTG